MLDSLMGPSRNQSCKEYKTDGWKDRNVCKRYLVGFCPNNVHDNWFKNTRRDVGTCTKVHSDRLRQDFEAHPERARYELEYEREFLQFLENLIREADAWIAREKRNCKPAGVSEMKMPQRVWEQMESMKEQSESLMKKAEELADDNQIAASHEAVHQSDKLREEIGRMKERHTVVTTGEEVCEICGVRCQPGEVADYQAHLDGKLHEGYLRVREEARKLREKDRLRPRAQVASSGDRGPEREKGEKGDKGGKDRGKAERGEKEKGEKGEKGERSRTERSRSRDRRSRDRRKDGSADRKRKRSRSKSRGRKRR